jgi:hypothetical protein
MATGRSIVIEIVEGQQVINFASFHLKMPFTQCCGIGFVENGQMLGAMVYDTYQLTADGKPLSLEISVIVLDKRCINRYTLKRIFCLPFSDIGVRRLQIRCGRSQKKKRRLVERLGFKYEGITRQGWPFGGDAAIYSMLPHECRWIRQRSI